MAKTAAGPVTVRRADGTEETRPAYDERELRKIQRDASGAWFGGRRVGSKSNTTKRKR